MKVRALSLSPYHPHATVWYDGGKPQETMYGSIEPGVALRQLPEPSGTYRGVYEVTVPDDAPVITWKVVTGYQNVLSPDERGIRGQEERDLHSGYLLCSLYPEKFGRAKFVVIDTKTSIIHMIEKYQILGD